MMCLDQWLLSDKRNYYHDTTPHTQRDLRFGVEQNVDVVFASFIRKAQDVHDVRAILGEDGKHILIFSKVCPSSHVTITWLVVV